MIYEKSTQKLKCITPWGGGGGGHSLIEVTREASLRFLPRAVQQLKILPRADTKSHVWHPKADTIPHFDSPRADK